jgi:hypothetical protein
VRSLSMKGAFLHLRWMNAPFIEHLARRVGRGSTHAVADKGCATLQSTNGAIGHG